MKNFYSLKVLAVSSFLGLLNAQIPTNYYSSAAGLTGYSLKTELSKIISNGAKDNGYDGLYTTYATSDVDDFYEKDGSVMDIYSENPAGKDPYNYFHGQKQCGSYSNEGDCYNREHIVPQSLFSKGSPMRNDAHFIVPTDGKVNGMRSNFPFGIVGKASFTSKNGTKVGTSITPGYSGSVAEPIDEFKGDVARMILYFVTRYESRLGSFSSGNMLAANADGLQKWELDILLKWHVQDPVNQREINRNNAVYGRQNNRNPFIDHPEYVAQIWGGAVVVDTEAPSVPKNLVSSELTSNSAKITWDASTDNVGVKGYNVYVAGSKVATVTTNSATLSDLSPNTAYNATVEAFDAAGNVSAKSTAVSFSTLQPDTEKPTEPTNVVVSNVLSNSAKVSWTASTDNMAVAGYNVYVNGVFKSKVNTTEAVISGLQSGTSYQVEVEAFDAAGNLSSKSVVAGFTTPAGVASCGTEDFEKVNVVLNKYDTYTWTGNNNITWTATDTRTDNTMDKKAVVIRNGSLKSSTISGGVGSITVDVQRMYSGGNGSFDVVVNGSKVGVINYTDQLATITISNINVSGDAVISIEKNSVAANRVGFDNLSWTCYSTLSTIENNKANTYRVYPNPVRNNDLYVQGDNLAKIEKADIYSITGQLVQSVAQPFKNGNKINLKSLPKGVYILKTSAFTSKFMVD